MLLHPTGHAEEALVAAVLVGAVSLSPSSR